MAPNRRRTSDQGIDSWPVRVDLAALRRPLPCHGPHILLLHPSRPAVPCPRWSLHERDRRETRAGARRRRPRTCRWDRRAIGLSGIEARAAPSLDAGAASRANALAALLVTRDRSLRGWRFRIAETSRVVRPSVDPDDGEHDRRPPRGRVSDSLPGEARSPGSIALDRPTRRRRVRAGGMGPIPQRTGSRSLRRDFGAHARSRDLDGRASDSTHQPTCRLAHMAGRARLGDVWLRGYGRSCPHRRLRRHSHPGRGSVVSALELDLGSRPGT